MHPLQQSLLERTQAVMQWDEVNIYDLQLGLRELLRLAVEWSAYTAVPHGLRDVIDVEALPTAGPLPCVSGHRVLAVDRAGRALLETGLRVVRVADADDAPTTRYAS